MALLPLNGIISPCNRILPSHPIAQKLGKQGTAGRGLWSKYESSIIHLGKNSLRLQWKNTNDPFTASWESNSKWRPTSCLGTFKHKNLLGQECDYSYLSWDSAKRTLCHNSLQHKCLAFLTWYSPVLTLFSTLVSQDFLFWPGMNSVITNKSAIVTGNSV